MILLLEGSIVGLITFIIGHLGFNLTTNSKNRDNKIKPQGINLAFFITGFILHIMFEYIGFNKFYCNKNCRRTIELLNS